MDLFNEAIYLMRKQNGDTMEVLGEIFSLKNLQHLETIKGLKAPGFKGITVRLWVTTQFNVLNLLGIRFS